MPGRFFLTKLHRSTFKPRNRKAARFTLLLVPIDQKSVQTSRSYPSKKIPHISSGRNGCQDLHVPARNRSADCLFLTRDAVKQIRARTESGEQWAFSNVEPSTTRVLWVATTFVFVKRLSRALPKEMKESALHIFFKSSLSGLPVVATRSVESGE